MLSTLRLKVWCDWDLIRFSNVKGDKEAGDTVVCCYLVNC